MIGRRVQLKKRGKDYVGLCPFHGENTPSFNVIPHKHMYHCFGCAESGDIFKFYMKLDGLPFTEAVRHVAQEAAIPLEEEAVDAEEARRRSHLDDLAALLERAVRFYENKLWHPSGQVIRDYLRGRGVKEEWTRKFRIGFGGHGRNELTRALQRADVPLALAVEAGLCLEGKNGRAPFDWFHGRADHAHSDSSAA